jgi:predicted nucleic acid-binding protein
MMTVFADTLYWIAVARPGDQWHDAAIRAKKSLGNVRLLTTDEVLTEFLAALSGGGEHIRRQAAKMVREILANPNVTMLPQTRDAFLRGLAFYEQRPDKQYSLTDCISMIAIRANSLTKVLTIDRHFLEEGFDVLMRRAKG